MLKLKLENLSNKINKLTINPDAKSSRFVVDLKKELPQEEVAQVKAKKFFEEKLEKLAAVNYGKMLKAGREKM